MRTRPPGAGWARPVPPGESQEGGAPWSHAARRGGSTAGPPRASRGAGPATPCLGTSSAEPRAAQVCSQTARLWRSAVPALWAGGGPGGGRDGGARCQGAGTQGPLNDSPGPVPGLHTSCPSTGPRSPAGWAHEAGKPPGKAAGHWLRRSATALGRPLGKTFYMISQTCPGRLELVESILHFIPLQKQFPLLRPRRLIKYPVRRERRAQGGGLARAFANTQDC